MGGGTPGEGQKMDQGLGGLSGQLGFLRAGVAECPHRTLNCCHFFHGRRENVLRTVANEIFSRFSLLIF